MKWVFFIAAFACLEWAAAEKIQKRELKIDRRSPWEYALLKYLLGDPRGNPNTAKALKGEKRTTKLHKLCSGKIQLRDEWIKDKSVYDKIICGMFTRQDEYKKHEEHVARILMGKTNGKTLDEQKDELIRAVNQMVNAAGPIPIIKINGK
ncbi:uncharacterized protein LOC111328405 [Stylophora pistillata]|uniref:Uncharacterized protein n=1 Tax=Stylophora pistillata TaxID=50429 RepID=A0A2B4SC03_STYPI|nr:uncharacterized protein LOC111328405 [Stylophora pistillata]XP_022788566.1 uncharacterized protein LOC111328405 [Stylophora pistillata]PFX26896.1 hypothetical protein AWC38_SpisGene8442 [Stylophora pistillata]